MKPTIKKSDPGACTNIGCVRHWPSKAAKEWSNEFVLVAQKHSSIDAIVAVGSAVRDVSESADIDFVLILNTTSLKFNRPPIDVDIRIYDRIDVEELLSKGHDLLGWAIRFGCVVYERNSYWTNLRSQWIKQLPLPSVEKATARAAKAKELYNELLALGDSDAANEQLLTMLTHLARARLIEGGVYPASRPELVEQLREIGEQYLARKLANALYQRRKAWGIKQRPIKRTAT